MDFAKCSPDTSLLRRRVLRELDLTSFLTPQWKLSLCLLWNLRHLCGYSRRLLVPGLQLLFLPFSPLLHNQNEASCACSEEKALPTGRFVWGVVATSPGPHCPFPVPLPGFASSRQNATECLKQARPASERVTKQPVSEVPGGSQQAWPLVLGI